MKEKDIIEELKKYYKENGFNKILLEFYSEAGCLLSSKIFYKNELTDIDELTDAIKDIIPKRRFFKTYIQPIRKTKRDE